MLLVSFFEVLDADDVGFATLPSPGVFCVCVCIFFVWSEMGQPVMGAGEAGSECKPAAPASNTVKPKAAETAGG